MIKKNQSINYLNKIILELKNNSRLIDSKKLEEFSEKIIQANHIFLAGAGRSGIMVQAFTNRLMHLGFPVSLVGNVNTPHSKPNDLLIICSGSGETDSLKTLVEKAKQSNVKIILVTMKKNSYIGKLADFVLELPGVTKSENRRQENSFLQPMGSSFEQLALLVFDSLVLTLMDKTGENSETMFARHTDFE